jgi:hypothetical protein
MFSYFINGIKDNKVAKNVSINQLVDLIRNNPNKETITRLHSLEYKSDAYNELKETLPYITPAGVFAPKRDKTKIKQVSGYLYFDVDVEGFDCDADCYKDVILDAYADIISLIGKSVGGRGIFFYVKVNNLTAENYTSAYEYMRTQVFGSINIDNNAKGIARPQFIPFDSEVYFDDTVSISIPNEYLVDTKSINQRIKYKKEECYTLIDTFLPITEVLKRLRFDTHIDVQNTDFDVNPMSYLRVRIYNNIKDGMKHRVFRGLVHSLVYLNPDADLLTIASYIAFVNAKRTTKPMAVKEMTRLVEHTFNQIKETGEINVKLKNKNVHFNKDCGLSGDEKRLIASKINGKLRTAKSLSEVLSAKQQLIDAGEKPTQAKVAELTGLGIATVKRYWKKEAEEVEAAIEPFKENIVVESIEAHHQDETENQGEVLSEIKVDDNGDLIKPLEYFIYYYGVDDAQMFYEGQFN